MQQALIPSVSGVLRSCRACGEILPTILEDFRPNLLANYVMELARASHSFFGVCPVLKSEEPTSGLALCELTSRALKKGLDLLGIEVSERM